MRYSLLIKPSAAKEARKISKSQRDKIRKAMIALQENPRPRGVKKLKGRIDIYRVRIGKYRVLYTIDEEETCVRILSILDRKEAYR